MAVAFAREDRVVASATFYLMLLAGMACLLSSLVPLASILRTVRQGRLRTQWLGLGGLILFFSAGYAGFGALRFAEEPTPVDSFVALIFMMGGVFVFAVARLSWTTTKDLVKITALERDVVRDPLTGAFNRRYLDARLDDEVGRAQRSGFPLSALMIDLDHFKHVNDTYGHAVGDVVLRHVCSLIHQHARVTDTVVRFGGEEFIVIAPNSTIDSIVFLGERMLREIQTSPIVLPDGSTLSVTASMGASSLVPEDSAKTLLTRADEALYSAKREGRNQLRIAVGSGW